MEHKDQSVATAEKSKPEELQKKQKAKLFQRKPKWRKWVKRLIPLVLIVAVAFYLLRGRQGGGSTVLAGYLPNTASYRDMTVSVAGTGTIQPMDAYRVTTLVKGEILEAPSEEGGTVEKGDVLFRLDAKTVEASIQQQEIALSQARVNYNNLLQSVSSNVKQQEIALSQAKVSYNNLLDTLNTTVQQQEITLEQAKVNYDSLIQNEKDANKNQQIKSDAAGVVTKVHIKQGDTIAAGTPIADVLDRDQMKLTVPFHASDVKNFFVGQSGVITVDGTLETVPAVIDSIAATDGVGAGGTLIREVTLVAQNPGALSDQTTATAAIGEADCAAGGTFAYKEQTQIVSKTGGEVETLTLKEGDQVTDGQVIGQFTANDMTDQIEAARLTVENAELALRTAKGDQSSNQVETARLNVESARLALQKAAGEEVASQLENARLSIEAAELSLQTAKDSLEDYVITSPISGTVIEMNYKVGDNIDPSASSASYLAVIYDMSALKFEMNIDELDISQIQVGQKVEITADALNGKTFHGRIDKVNINGTTNNGVTTYPVTVLVDDPKELLPGMNISARIIVEEAGSVLSIPVGAVSRGNQVLVAGPGAMNEDGTGVVDPSKLQTVEVVLGRNDDSYIEVVSGLSEGDIVLTENAASNAMAMMMG